MIERWVAFNQWAYSRAGIAVLSRLQFVLFVVLLVAAIILGSVSGRRRPR